MTGLLLAIFPRKYKHIVINNLPERKGWLSEEAKAIGVITLLN